MSAHDHQQQQLKQQQQQMRVNDEEEDEEEEEEEEENEQLQGEYAGDDYYGKYFPSLSMTSAECACFGRPFHACVLGSDLFVGTLCSSSVLTHC